MRAQALGCGLMFGLRIAQRIDGGVSSTKSVGAALANGRLAFQPEHTTDSARTGAPPSAARLSSATGSGSRPTEKPVCLDLVAHHELQFQPAPAGR